MNVKLRCINCGQKYKFSVEPGVVFEFTCIKCQTDQSFQSPDEAGEPSDEIIMVEARALNVPVEPVEPEQKPEPESKPEAPPVPPALSLKPPRLNDLKPLSLKHDPAPSAPKAPPVKPEMSNVPKAPRQSLNGNQVPVPRPGFEAEAAKTSENHLSNENQVTIIFDDDDGEIDGNIADKIRMVIKWTFRVAGIIVLVAVCWGVWKFFLDPGGKVAWRKELPITSFVVMDNSNGKLTFMNGAEVMVLDSEKGEITTRGKIPELEKHPQILHRMDKDRIIFSGSKDLALIDLSGKKHWEKSFEFPVGSVYCGKNIAVVQTVESIKIKEEDGYPIYDHHYRAMALNLENGQELWKRGPQKNESFFDQAMAGGNTLIYHEYEKIKEDDKEPVKRGRWSRLFNSRHDSQTLVAMDMTSGKPIWRLKLEGETTWGPLIKESNLIFKQRNKLIAIDLAGGNVKWELTVRGNPWREFAWGSLFDFGGLHEPDSTANPNMVYFTTALSMAAVDVAGGKELWNQKFASEPNISEVSDKFFFIGSVRDKESRPDDNVKLPKDFEQLKNEEPALGLSGATGGPMKKTVRGVACYSTGTGKQLWQLDQIFGRVIASGDRVVIFWDSADTTTSNMLGSRHGQTVVQQYSAKSGKRLFNKSDKAALSGPYLICGRKLVALTYDRAVGNRAKRDGIIAFNLK